MSVVKTAKTMISHIIHRTEETFLYVFVTRVNNLAKSSKLMLAKNLLILIFNQLFVEEDIIHVKIIRHNPESISKAYEKSFDRKWSPLCFWAETRACSGHLTILTPRKGKENKTPFELWCGEIPNVSYLKVFGCVAYFDVPRVERNKPEATAKRAVMVEYSI